MRIVNFTCVALLIGASGYAQDDTARRQATEVAARVPLEQAIKGAPYSAETVVEAAQQLADGNRISNRTSGRVYRDSEGRTRREEERESAARFAAGGAFNFKRTTISITDPVGGFSYSLDPENKIAWRTPIGAAGAIMTKLELAQGVTDKRAYEEKLDESGRAVVGFVATPLSVEEKQKVEAAAAARGAGGAARGGGGGRGGTIARGRGNIGVANMPETPLEHKTLEGIPVEGRKTTTVIPVGQIGNEQPITITSEEWRSPDLNVLIMTKHSDPRTGESTYRLQNIIRAEPDRSLFMVPADYTVKDTGVRRIIRDLAQVPPGTPGR